MRKLTYCISICLLGIFFIFSANLSFAAESKKPVTFTLEDAILLASRSNPNLQSARLSDVSQKFNLFVEEWAFMPHYGLQAHAKYVKTRSGGGHTIGSHNYNIKPSISLLTPIGTTLSVGADNPIGSHYNPGLSVEISQPLLRGFGRAIVEAELNNARDSNIISKLNIEGTLRSTVTEVIEAYLEVVAAERTIVIDESALKRATQSVEQTRLFIKAGRKAGNEIVTVEANVARAKTQLENDKNTLTQARYALLAAIGVDPYSPIKFIPLNISKLIKKYHLPDVRQMKELVLNNDIQYQTDLITLHGSKQRSLVKAQDNTRWKLNFTANASTGNGTGHGFNSGFNSLYNSANHSRSAGLTLEIPIDDQLAKQGVLNAKIALRQAEIGLKNSKWKKETSALNGYNLVVSAKKTLYFAEDAKRLQQKTYEISFQKYLHGLVDSLELQSAQVQLIQTEQDLLRAQISYLRALVQLDNLIGHTLKTWDINVRY